MNTLPYFVPSGLFLVLAISLHFYLHSIMAKQRYYNHLDNLYRQAEKLSAEYSLIIYDGNHHTYDEINDLSNRLSKAKLRAYRYMINYDPYSPFSFPYIVKMLLIVCSVAFAFVGVISYVIGQ